MTLTQDHFGDIDRLLPATRTTQPDIARSHLAAIFADHDLRLAAGRVDFSHQQARLCEAEIGLLRYGTEVEVIAPALDCYVAQLTLDGEVAFRTEHFETRLTAGTMFVMNPGLRYRKTWSRDARQLMIKIPRERLHSHVGRAVRFAPRPIGATDGVVGYLAHLCRDLASGHGLSVDQALRREMESLLLSALISTQPCLPENEPCYLHVAEDYIREQLSRSVSLAELSAVSGASERALQQAFRQYRSTCPSDYSRDLRLDAARAALREGLAVTEAALEFGFSHFGRFAQSYAARFGEKPSETVRKARH